MAACFSVLSGQAVFTAVLIAALIQGSESYAGAIPDFVQVSMQVDGSTSLPDPAPLNAFLQSNTTLTNPLIPSQPPLELQICNASILNQPAFNFYTIQHPGGCGSAPGLASNPKQEKVVSLYETIILLWYCTLLAFICFCAAGCYVSERVRLSVDCVWQGYRQLEAATWRTTYRRERRSSLYGIARWMFSPGFHGVPIYFALSFLGVGLYLDRYGVKHLEVVALPDPSDLNNVLRSNGQNVTLSLCSVDRGFQVYVGFSNGCNQLGRILYTDVWYPATNLKAAHGPLVMVLMCVTSAVAFSSWFFLAGGVLYGCCSYWHSREIVENLVTAKRQEKENGAQRCRPQLSRKGRLSFLRDGVGESAS